VAYDSQHSNRIAAVDARAPRAILLDARPTTTFDQADVDDGGLRQIDASIAEQLVQEGLNFGILTGGAVDLSKGYSPRRISMNDRGESTSTPCRDSAG